MLHDGTYFPVSTHLDLGIVNLLTLLRGPLIEGASGHELAALFACIVPPALLLVSGSLGCLVEADHGRHHGRHHDDAQDHGGCEMRRGGAGTGLGVEGY